MRDLATYESNFAENSGIRGMLMKMHKMVAMVKEKVHVRAYENTDN
jgi:hypothetical protein